MPHRRKKKARKKSKSRKFLTMREAQLQHVLAAIDYCKGNKTQAAKILGIARSSVIRIVQR